MHSISMLLLFQLFLCAYGASDLFFHDSWKMQNSCEKHPFALEKGVFKDELVNYQKQIRCTLKFDHPERLLKNSANKQDHEDHEQQAKDMCEQLYPEKFLDWSWENDQLTCKFHRTRYCENKQAVPVAGKCVYLYNTANTWKDAHKKCKNAGKEIELIGSNEQRVLNFFKRLYKWPQPTSAVWFNDNLRGASLVYMNYGAIGSYSPGDMEYVENPQSSQIKATVMCVGPSQVVPGANVKTSHLMTFCNVLTNFFLLKTFEKGETCYSISLSLRQRHRIDKAKQGNTDQVWSIAHFHASCPLRNAKRDQKFAVFPSSQNEINTLKHFQGHHKLKEIMIPGAQIANWNVTPDDTIFTQKMFEQSMFNYQRFATKKVKAAAAGFSSHLWQAGHPNDLKDSTTHDDVLIFNGNGKVQNTVGYRRGPVVCGTGIQQSEMYECPDGWEMVERPEKRYALCYKAAKMQCPSRLEAVEKCKTLNPQAKLAPAANDEESATVARAVKNEWGRKITKETVLLGSAIDKNNKQYWDKWDDGDYEPITWGWIDGEPDHRRRFNCGKNFWGSLRAFTNYLTDKFNINVCKEYLYDACAAARFSNWGAIEGLHDVTCENGCMSIGYLERANLLAGGAESNEKYVTTIACAMKATNKRTDFS